jgi:hypothetical protein
MISDGRGILGTSLIGQITTIIKRRSIDCFVPSEQKFGDRIVSNLSTLRYIARLLPLPQWKRKEMCQKTMVFPLFSSSIWIKDGHMPQ